MTFFSRLAMLSGPSLSLPAWWSNRKKVRRNTRRVWKSFRLSGTLLQHKTMQRYPKRTALQSTLGVQVSLWQNKAHQLEQENAELQYALDLESVNLFD